MTMHIAHDPADAVILLDEAGLRDWLRAYAERLGIDDGLSREELTIAGRLVTITDELGAGNAPPVWTMRLPLESVSIWPTADDDGVDGGAIITADLRVDGHPIRLACLHQSSGDFTDGRCRGVDAAVQAIAAVTALVNHEVATYLRATAPPPHGKTDTDAVAWAGDVAAALNATADDLLQVADVGGEGLRDAVNLTINAALVYLQRGWLIADPAAARDRLEQVANSSYDTDLDTILGWIDTGPR